MSSYSATINLQQLPGAEVMNIETGNGVKPYICIPLDAPFVYNGKKGCYASFLEMETQNNQYGNSHFIKPSISKEAYDRMTEDQRKAIPICGNMKVVEFGGNQAPAQPIPSAKTVRVQPYQQTAPAQPVQQSSDPHEDPNLPF